MQTATGQNRSRAQTAATAIRASSSSDEWFRRQSPIGAGLRHRGRLLGVNLPQELLGHVSRHEHFAAQGPSEANTHAWVPAARFENGHPRPVDRRQPGSATRVPRAAPGWRRTCWSEITRLTRRHVGARHRLDTALDGSSSIQSGHSPAAQALRLQLGSPGAVRQGPGLGQAISQSANSCDGIFQLSDLYATILPNHPHTTLRPP